MKSVEILNGGMLTTIQDKGRIGFQSFGVPVSGAVDSYSMQVANILVDNNRYEGVLECTVKGPVIRFNYDACFAITGANMQPKLNGEAIELNKLNKAKNGSVLELGYSIKGCRSYIAIGGGFDIPIIMGSKSTFLRGKFGGLNGRKLQSGDLIPLNDNYIAPLYKRGLTREYIGKYENSVSLRLILGSEDDCFTDKGLESFLSSEYKITGDSDRMGYRLDGPDIEHKDKADILSNGINLGAIQVPGSKKPIIMLADRQTTGGYTKIANVISVDIPKLAQLMPGDTVRFEKVAIDYAQQLIRKQEEDLQKLTDYFKKIEESVCQGKSKMLIIKINDKVYNVGIHESE